MHPYSTSTALKLEDRRLKYERRQYSYAGHIPERRSGQDRREEGDDATPDNIKR